MLQQGHSQLYAALLGAVILHPKKCASMAALVGITLKDTILGDTQTINKIQSTGIKTKQIIPAKISTFPTIFPTIPAHFLLQVFQSGEKCPALATRDSDQRRLIHSVRPDLPSATGHATTPRQNFGMKKTRERDSINFQPKFCPNFGSGCPLFNC